MKRSHKTNIRLRMLRIRRTHLALALCLIGGLLLQGCLTYYYPAIKSFENRIPQNKNGSFTAENSRISVTYSFKNSGGKIVYEINNESDDPIFVDWSRSVFIAEDYAVPYLNNKAQIGGSVEATTTTYRFSKSNYVTSTSYGDLKGEIILPQNDLFIPPHAKTSYSPLQLSAVLNLDKIPASSYQKQNNGIATLNVASFSEENTPLKFRSYLTIVNDRDKSQTVFEHTFFVSDIIKTGSENPQLTLGVNSGSRFYIQVANKDAQTTGWVIAGALGVGLIVLGANSQ